MYSFEYHSLLKWCFQKKQSYKLAWCSLLQLRHLNMWGQSLPFFVSNLGGLVFLLALQHHTKWQWYLVRWGLLHLTHLDLCIWQTPAVWSYFQQFLHCGIPGFIFVLWAVAMKLLMLNLQLMTFLALVLFCISQMLIHMMAMLDLGDILIMHGLEVRTMLLNKWLFFRTFLILSNEIWLFIFSLMYRIPTILRYDFNCSNLGKETFSTSEDSEFFYIFFNLLQIRS